MAGQQLPDGQVEGYQRIVNGKVVNVSGYGKKSSPSTTALKRAWETPGRPRVAARPGAYSGGRSIPGIPAELHLIPDASISTE